ncbi:MAG: hypothetical protein RLY49_38 [Candidatus Parcubacteria bacterium]
MDILSCNWDKAHFLIFSSNVFDPLIYYSHILPVVCALFLGIFVFFQDRSNKVNRLFFYVTLCFSVWTYFDLVLWASEKPDLIMLFWSGMIYFEYALFTFSFFLMYRFLFRKDLLDKFKLIFIVPFIPVLLFANSNYNLISYDLTDCERGVFEGALWTYMYILEAVLISFSIIIVLFYIYKNGLKNKKQEVLFSVGIIAFMFVFFGGNITLLSNMSWDYEQYKLFGMLVLLIILIFLIVRFKTFNIKLIGAQALVWVMVILIGAQFLFIQNNINKILNSITFITVSISGLALVRSIRKVDSQKIQLEKINQNQQSLLHFVTHQIKGYLTKSRNIFDGMVTKDYGELPPKALEMAQYGFASDTRAVETVLAILKASDLKTGKTEFKKELTNISSIVAEIIENKKDQAQEKGLDLTFDIEPNITIQADPIHIKEVFKNLIANAILYTPSGQIKVLLTHENKNIKFSVIDTGIGLTSEDKEKLFTEGGKGEDALKVNVDSTGYGLYVAKEIILKHQGKIGALSEGRGKGSEFFVLLPNIQ